MAEKKIGEIKEELKAVDDEKLPSFIETYEKDERSGVVKIVEQAKKRFEKLEAEKLRIENLKKYEREYADYGYICGIDEVGRGPLAGPVVAGAVILPKDCDILYINDSKKLSAAKREELYDVIMEKAVAVGMRSRFREFPSDRCQLSKEMQKVSPLGQRALLRRLQETA